MNNLVEIYDGEPRTGTFLISQGFEREHQTVIKLIKKHEQDFIEFENNKGFSKPLIIRKIKSKKAGRQVEEILLNEGQTIFLGTLFRNTNRKVIQFKKSLVKDYIAVKAQLDALQSHKDKPEYKITREAGIIVRKEATDTMKAFQEYAREQGSKSPEMYYMSITKMMNGLLFIVEGKFKNLRNVMTIPQLMTVSSAEHIINKALSDGMKKNMFYKDIFQEVKKKVMIFAELHGQSEVIDEQLKLAAK